MKFTTIAEVKKANREKGDHWFEASSMRFFDSRVYGKLYGGEFFISSEQFHGSQGSAPRKFTIRQVMADGSVETYGKFQEFDTLEEARRVARALGTLVIA